MNISEKVAYLKGLAEGMKVSDASNEGKLLIGILGVLEEVSQSIDVLEFDIDMLDNQLSEIDDYCDCDCEHDDYDEYDGDIYEVDCPKCGETTLLDEEGLDEGEVLCYNCGNKIEIDFDVDSEIEL